MAHRPLLIANEFLRLHGADGNIDHLKLQKLTYFAQGWWLAVMGSDLVTERPQVWRYGPVFQSLYSIFSPAGSNKITHPKRTLLFRAGQMPTLEGEDTKDERDLIEWIWGEYGNLTGAQLSDLTHKVGTPWWDIAVRENFQVPLNTVIPRDADWSYFSEMARERGFVPEPLVV